MEMFLKHCNICGSIIRYKNKNSYCANRKKKSMCKKCKSSFCSEKMKGKKRPMFTEEWRKNLAEGHKNSILWKLSMNTPEYKEKQKISKLGNKNGMFGKTHTKEVKDNISKCLRNRMSIKENVEKLKNRVWTHDQIEKHKISINRPERLQVLREKRLNHLKKSGKFPSYNENGCSVFDYINNKMNWSGLHALNGGERELNGYSLDYYEPNLNLIIEWDEERHYKNKGCLLKDDVERQNNILSNNNCEFYRIREKTKIVYKVGNSLKDKTDVLQSIVNEYYEKTKSD